MLLNHQRLPSASLLDGISRDLNSFLLYGHRGVGKSFLVDYCFNQYGYAFVYNDFYYSPDLIKNTINGIDIESSPEIASKMAPGLAKYSDPVVIVFNNFQRISDELKHILINLLRTRKIQDSHGSFWSISRAVKIVCILDLVQGSNITITDPIISYFNFRQEVADNITDMAQLHDCFSQKYNISNTQVNSVVCSLTKSFGYFKDKLRAVDRIYSSLATNQFSKRNISDQEFNDAVKADLKHILLDISYKGKCLTFEHYTKWEEQFGEEYKFLPGNILRNIHDKYYISTKKYYDLLDEMIRRSGIKSSDNVVFCKWQKLGKSSPKISNDIKNQARWRVLGDIDLDKPLSGVLNSGKKFWLIIIDDFIGSGETLLKLVAKNSNLMKLLRLNPDLSVCFFAMAGYRNSFMRFYSRITEIDSLKNFKVIFGKIFEEHDKCFSNDSVLFDGDSKIYLKCYCDKFAKKYFPSSRKKMRYGFNNISSLVVFEHTVPNNSLPILWFDTSSWYPLFPASRLIPD